MKQKIILLATTILITSCAGNPLQSMKKSANNKWVDAVGFQGGKRRPSLNKKYIELAKQNLLEENIEDVELDDENELSSFLEENRQMYLRMIKEDNAKRNARKKRNLASINQKQKLENLSSSLNINRMKIDAIDLAEEDNLTENSLAKDNLTKDNLRIEEVKLSDITDVYASNKDGYNSKINEEDNFNEQSELEAEKFEVAIDLNYLSNKNLSLNETKINGHSPINNKIGAINIFKFNNINSIEEEMLRENFAKLNSKPNYNEEKKLVNLHVKSSQAEHFKGEENSKYNSTNSAEVNQNNFRQDNFRKNDIAENSFTENSFTENNLSKNKRPLFSRTKFKATKTGFTPEANAEKIVVIEDLPWLSENRNLNLNSSKDSDLKKAIAQKIIQKKTTENTIQSVVSISKQQDLSYANFNSGKKDESKAQEEKLSMSALEKALSSKKEINTKNDNKSNEEIDNTVRVYDRSSQDIYSDERALSEESDLDRAAGENISSILERQKSLDSL